MRDRRPKSARHTDGALDALADNTREISRRSFVVKGGGLLIAAGVGASCTNDGTAGGGPQGTIHLIINGLDAAAAHGGTASITPTSGSTITITIPKAGDQSAEVPSGTYTVVYTPPPSHQLAAGTSAPTSVTINPDEVTTVTLSLQALGSVAVTVTGLTGSGSGGSAVAQRTDAAGTPINIPISGAGTGTASAVPVGTYSITYTPPAGVAVTTANPVTGVQVTMGASAPAAFTVTVQAGTIHVAVTGLTGAAAGGSVSARRTDNTGNTFTGTLPVPAAGSAAVDLTGLPPANYNVTYTAPSGYRLQTGVTNPQQATVTNGGTSNVTFAGEPVPQGGIAFQSDWSTGTGTGDAALRDTNKAHPWEGEADTSPNILSVVPATGLGFPSTNVLRVAHLTGGGGTAWLAVGNAWALPAIGQSLYYRFYLRVDVADSEGNQGGANHHPIETNAPAGSGFVDGGWEFKFGWNSNGTWPVLLGLNGVGSPQYQWTTYASAGGNTRAALQKNTVYRFEFKFTRTAANQWSVAGRTYLGTGTTPVFDETTWKTTDTAQSMASNGLNINMSNSDNQLTKLRFGVNGGPFVNAVQYHYFGSVMVRTDDWCGP